MPEIVEQKRKQKILNSFLSRATDLAQTGDQQLDQELQNRDSMITPFVSNHVLLSAQNSPNLRELDVGSITCLRIGQQYLSFGYL